MFFLQTPHCINIYLYYYPPIVPSRDHPIGPLLSYGGPQSTRHTQCVRSCKGEFLIKGTIVTFSHRFFPVRFLKSFLLFAPVCPLLALALAKHALQFFHTQAISFYCGWRRILLLNLWMCCLDLSCCSFIFISPSLSTLIPNSNKQSPLFDISLH